MNPTPPNADQQAPAMGQTAVNPQQWLVTQRQQGHELLLIIDSLATPDPLPQIFAATPLREYINLYKGTEFDSFASMAPWLIKVDESGIGAVLELLKTPEQHWGWIASAPHNLEGDDYQHHGEQRHFMPRKEGGGSEKSILWQPKSATIEMTHAARFAADIALEDDMPTRKSFMGTVMSAHEHTLVSGYGPAALANLLRWGAAAWERDGQLFTAKESKDLLETIDTLRSAMRDWQPGSYLMFETQLKLTPDQRFANKSAPELRSLYDQDIVRLRTLKADEENALRRARKRLKAQAEHPISREDVFGDTLSHEQFDQIVAEWLALADVKKAQRLAKAGPLPSTQVV